MLLKESAPFWHVISGAPAECLSMGATWKTENTILSSKIIACDEMVLAYAYGFTGLSHQDESIAIEQLLDLPFIDFELGQGTRKVNDSCFTLHGLNRKITFEVSDLQTLISLVERKMGVALLPQKVVLAHRHSLKMSTIRNTDLCWELAVVWLSDGPNSLKVHDRPVQEFLDILQG